MPHSFSPVEVLEFGTSLILVPLLCVLKNHGIIGSALPRGRLLIVNLIEQGYLLIVGTPMIFYILWSSLTVRNGGAVVGVSYGIPELHSRLDVAFNVIHGMHQLSMNLKTYFVSTT
jgi:hypothetical protein